MACSSDDGDSAPAAEEYVPLAKVLHLRSYNARRVNASNGELLAHHIFQSGYSTIAAVFAVGYDSRKEWVRGKTPDQILFNHNDVLVCLSDGGHRRFAFVLLYKSALARDFLSK